MRSWTIASLRILAVLTILTSIAAAAAEKPSVLFCSPSGVWQGDVDLDWLRELHAAGFEPDWLDNHRDFAWERIKNYHCIVIYGCPPAEAEWGFFPAYGPRQKEYIETVEKYLEAGGGVFCAARDTAGDVWSRPMIEPWGARLPYERYEEDDKTRIRAMPRMRGHESLARIDQALPSPVSEGVRNLWWPYGPYYQGSWTAPISVSNDWQVVVKGTATSKTVPVDPSKETAPPPPGCLVREGGVKEPPLLAIREYRKGRILLVAQQAQWTFGQGTKWLYDRRCLSRGFDGIPSDSERLIINALRWLAEPGMKSGTVGGYAASPGRFDPPNLQPEMRKQFEETFWGDEELDLHRPPRGGTIYRGLIGAQSAIGGASGTAAEYAAAAKEAGLDFVIFMDDFAKLTERTLAQLAEECQKQSDDKVLLIPGYRIDTNVGDHMFLYGLTPVWPLPMHLTGPNNSLLNLQYQNEKGEYELRPTVLEWLLAKWHREDANAGYYDFSGPTAQKMEDLRLFSAAAVFFYRDGKLVEDRTEDFLSTAQGTLAPGPVSVSLVRSPQELKESVAAGHALTYIKARSLDNVLKDGLRWTHQYDGVGLFTSTGPRIEAWPQCYRVHVYGAEPFVAGRELMLSEVHVRSDAGLKEIRIYNGKQLFRRFLPNGAKEYRQIMHLPGVVHQNLVLIAEDAKGGKAVSYARRCWKEGSLGVSFCSDHVNDGRGHLARGPGAFPVYHAPEIPGGETWDGGPQGLKPVVAFCFNHLFVESDKGTEDGQSWLGARPWRNVPIIEFGDDQALVVRSTLDYLYDPKVPAVNPWHTYGPITPSRLASAVRRYWRFNQPIANVSPAGWAANSVRTGAALSCYSNTVTFKQDQTLNKLLLLHTIWTNIRPIMMAAGEGKSTDARVMNLHQGQGEVRVKLQSGEWFGLYSPVPSNNLVMINRGEPVVVRVDRGSHAKMFHILGDVEGKTVKAGESLHYEIFSISDPVDAEARGPERFSQMLAYLENPVGVEIRRGQRIPSVAFFEVEAREHVAEIVAPQPEEPVNLTLPVRVRGLNPNWSAGFYQVNGRLPGYYSDGKAMYQALGFDFDGRVYGSLFPDKGNPHHVMIGHPVVCDRPELRIEVMPRPAGRNARGYKWHVAVNNPTDEAIAATFRQAMPVRDLAFQEQKQTVGPGEYLVLLR